jgi:Na+-driven multidrug efflux pump
MLCLNVVLDVVVLSLGFGLESVAIVSAATYGLGVVYGLIAIRKEVKLQIVRSLRMSIGLVLSKIKHLVAKRE